MVKSVSSFNNILLPEYVWMLKFYYKKQIMLEKLRACLKTEPNHRNQFSLQAFMKLLLKFSNSFLDNLILS
ncbi:hypothetical protein AUK04_00015 [Candidatus Roizmanbacteria bacterium CG2_30_33_16]|uniref:Uncharacterized protein n=2 Tax=Candidatus Roizmaniibacteriota TaxID=1752723 RepID=A0A2H0C454_9BACT|nr:MAG: hypothetical protein AUK04_00015 [Candidatus Roizmanbacteria bacterium CG2_30_33_16]PIP64088.1 MAG: hypothetical protein COW96_04530 [Candidatus Roizmanbacteria bacterium CG22_combo_CG10-13_8_21_14_all_33_16]